jgi:hypothetical protein
MATAGAIQELFFEVLIAPAFDEDALSLLKTKKNRILLKLTETPLPTVQYRSLLNGLLVQDQDTGEDAAWKEEGGRITSAKEKEQLVFANRVCKHLKSNAIAIIKDDQLIGKGCGQTSRIDALRQAIAKAHQFGFSLEGAVLASDAFFPFDDCVKISHEAGITAFIQPGGSIRDADSINYCKANGLAIMPAEPRERDSMKITLDLLKEHEACAAQAARQRAQRSVQNWRRARHALRHGHGLPLRLALQLRNSELGEREQHAQRGAWQQRGRCDTCCTGAAGQWCL